MVPKRSSSALKPTAFAGSGRDWCAVLSEMYFPLEVRPRDVEPLRGAAAKRSFGSLGFSRLATPYLDVARTPLLIAEDKVEEFCFVFPLAGSCHYRQRGRQRSAASGQLYVVNGAEPYDVEHSDGTKLVCLTVPCDPIRERVRHVDDLIAGEFRANPLVAAALGSLVMNTMSDGLDASIPRVEALCLNMIGLMFAPGSTGLG